MSKSKILIGIVVALVLVVGGAGYLYDVLGSKMPADRLADSGSSVAAAQEKTKAPDFTVFDKGGKAVKLSDYRGKPVVLNFWASWCPPCRREMPDFNDAYLKQGGEVSFLMINMTDGSRETVEKASAYVGEMGFALPVFYDKEFNAADAYKIRSLPTTYFIDAEGNIAAQAVGSIDSAALQQGINRIK